MSLTPVPCPAHVKHRLFDYATDPSLTADEKALIKSQYKLHSLRPLKHASEPLDSWVYSVPFQEKVETGPTDNTCCTVKYVTGKNCLDFFAYTFRVRGCDTEWIVAMDHQTGLVKSSPVFKSLQFAKGVPKETISKSPGLFRVSVCLTGGRTEIQGFWLPHGCAFELFSQFARDIRCMLYPIFGRKILDARRCPREDVPNLLVDNATILEAARALWPGNNTKVAALSAAMGGAGAAAGHVSPIGDARRMLSKGMRDSRSFDSVETDSAYGTIESGLSSPDINFVDPSNWARRREGQYSTTRRLRADTTETEDETPTVRRSKRLPAPTSSPVGVSKPSAPSKISRLAKKAAVTKKSKDISSVCEPRRVMQPVWVGPELAERRHVQQMEKQAVNSRVNSAWMNEADQRYKQHHQHQELVDQRTGEYTSGPSASPAAPWTGRQASGHHAAQAQQSSLLKTDGAGKQTWKLHARELRAAIAMIKLSKGQSTSGWMEISDEELEAELYNVRFASQPPIVTVTDSSSSDESADVEDSGDSEMMDEEVDSEDVQMEDADDDYELYCRD